jgi:hypothetical protein
MRAAKSARQRRDREDFGAFRLCRLSPCRTGARWQRGHHFFNHGMEGRLEVTQAQQGVWRGASGAQIVSRDFDVHGDEAFLPKNSTRQIGVFTLQQVQLGAVKLEAGAL